MWIIKKHTKKGTNKSLSITRGEYREALDIMEIKRYCCRRMFLTHVEIIDELLKYKSVNCLNYEFQEKQSQEQVAKLQEATSTKPSTT